MSKLKKVFGSGHIQIALATGISIVVMAYMSKRVMEEPISDLFLAIPPFIMTLYETVLRAKKKGEGKTAKGEGKTGEEGDGGMTAAAKQNTGSPNTALWVAVIFAATAAVILNGMR